MPTYDRTVCSIPKAQISFIEYFIEDMFEHWDEFVDLPEVMANLQANTVYWRESVEEDSDQSSHSSTETFSKQNNSIMIQRNDSIKEDSESELYAIEK